MFCEFASRHKIVLSPKTDSFLVDSPRWHSMQRGNKTPAGYVIVLRSSVHLGPDLFHLV